MTKTARPQLELWQASYHRRLKLYPEKITSNECLRLIHKEGTPLRMDKLGQVAALGWWSEAAPTKKQWTDIQTFLSSISIFDWVFRHFSKTGNSNEKLSSSGCPEVWTGLENGVIFEFRRSQGHSAGLFLDQRDHRENIRTHAQNKSILNLFAYTAGFSVYGALGGARSTTTVDLSPKYIEWSKKNFELNRLDVSAHKFHAMDSLEFLNYAARKGLKYDIIICDPPSYSRNKGKDFRVDRDFPLLLKAMSAVLAPEGQIHFSTNYENWSAAQWEIELKSEGKSQKLSVERLPHTSLDFEEDGSKSLMKAFHITKKT